VADTFRFVVPGGGASVNIRNPASAKENQVVTNQGPGTAFLGQATGVTTATGIAFPPGSRLEVFANGTSLWAIAAAGLPANLTVEAGIGAQ
jgi:hypothetical protein